VPGASDAIVDTPDEAQLPQLAKLLVRSLDKDALFQWMFPGVTDRSKVAPSYFRLQLEAGMKYGSVRTVDREVGTAVWFPPGFESLPDEDSQSFVRTLVTLYGDRPPRALEAETALATIRPEEPHHYLSYVGVEPSFRGQRAGTALVTDFLERCDAEASAAFLEAPHSVSQYFTRFGFHPKSSVVLGDVEVVGMWRNARP
jgi:predicted GNAT family N-acyltransferase